MNTIDYLHATRALISEPEHWTQKTSARNANGDPVAVLDREAFSYCLTGAVKRVTNVSDAYSDVIRALQSFDPRGWSLMLFNDSHTHAEVLHWIDKAIEAA